MSQDFVEALKLLDIIGIYFICPITAILIDLAIRKKKGVESDTVLVAGKWLTFFLMGVAPLVAGFMQAFIPEFTATMLQVTESNYIVIRELGYAALGVGVVGVLSFRFSSWRLPVCIIRGIFILCAILIHFTRIEILNTAEVLAIAADIITVGTAVFVILNAKRISGTVK